MTDTADLMTALSEIDAGPMLEQSLAREKSTPPTVTLPSVVHEQASEKPAKSVISEHVDKEILTLRETIQGLRGEIQVLTSLNDRLTFRLDEYVAGQTALEKTRTEEWTTMKRDFELMLSDSQSNFSAHRQEILDSVHALATRLDNMRAPGGGYEGVYGANYNLVHDDQEGGNRAISPGLSVHSASSENISTIALTIPPEVTRAPPPAAPRGAAAEASKPKGARERSIFDDMF